MNHNWRLAQKHPTRPKETGKYDEKLWIPLFLLKFRNLAGIIMAEMKSCAHCKKYQWCLSLCEEARRYVSRDEVKQREKTIGIPIFGSPLPSLPSKIILTKTQKKIVTLLSRKIGRSDTQNLLGLSPVNLRQQIYKIRRKYYE